MEFDLEAEVDHYITKRMGYYTIHPATRNTVVQLIATDLGADLKPTLAKLVAARLDKYLAAM